MPTDNEIFETDENGLATLDWGDQPKAITETLVWLDYVRQLDPDDESGAFLIPADLKAVDGAYARLQLSGSGTPHFPGSQTHVASSADDDFIKRKMATAIERARKVAIDPATISVKVIRYERGLISGPCKLILPQGKTIQLNFVKEHGWKAEVEIDRGDEIITRTTYVRGMCMNAITSTVIVQEVRRAEYDYSEIDFQPLP
jgi:hypothetical protein